MAISSNVSNKKVLIVDDKMEMRNQLKMTLSALGFEKLHTSSSIKEAMSMLENIEYDVLLCEYSLGDSTNGQQFLEFLRTHDLLSRNCMFIIITAESAYDRVAMAVECMPDDYLLKPFTAGQFLTRFERLLERQQVLAAIDQAHDKKDWHKVCGECDKILILKNKYYLDVCRIKAAALMRIEHAEDAIALYNEVLQIKDLPWAHLGLARAHAALGNAKASEAISYKLMESNPQFVANFDFASEMLMQEDRTLEAFDVLKKAAHVYPGNLSRTRHLTVMAIANGEHEMAETLMADTLKTHKHSPIREAADYALLATALTEQGKTKDALTTLASVAGQFSDANSGIVLLASSSLAHFKDGNLEAAEAALNQALEGVTNLLPPSVATIVAQTCFAMGREDTANSLLKQILQNNPDDTKLLNRVKMVCAISGKKPEEAAALIQASAKEIIKINNEGVRKAQDGEYKEAIALIVDAAERLPNNLNIISNAALILAVYVANGASKDELVQCLQYRQKVMDKNPTHPKLTQIDMMLKKVKVTA